MTVRQSSRDVAQYVAQSAAAAARNTGGQQQPADKELQLQTLKLNSRCVRSSILSTASGFSQVTSLLYSFLINNQSHRKMIHPKPSEHKEHVRKTEQGVVFLSGTVCPVH